MVYCSQAQMAFSTAARRDAVLADLVSFTNGKGRWNASADVLEPADLTKLAGPFGLIAEVRFTARQDADDMLARAVAFAVGPRLPLPGSWMRLHDCTHDGTPVPCVPDAQQVW